MMMMDVNAPAVEPLRVKVAHGDLAFSTDPVAIGHYEGDTIAGAEKYLDAELNGRLTLRRQIGLYPGRIGTAEVVLNTDPWGKPGGAVIVGLGPVGKLSPGELTNSFAKAILRYSVKKTEEAPLESSDDGLGLASLLIGTGTGGFLAFEDSIAAILEGALQANLALEEAGVPRHLRLMRLSFLELYLDQAILAVRAARRIAQSARFSGRVELDEELETVEGGRQRAFFEEAAGWWARLQVVRRDGTLHFTPLTDRAGAEVFLRPTQRALVDRLVADAIENVSPDPDIGATLFELLLPNRLKEAAPERRDLVLMLDEGAASYPWELLYDRNLETAAGESRPLAVRAGLIRQLVTPVYQDRVISARGFDALVVGDPPSGFSRLPAAENEARAVADLLEGKRPGGDPARQRYSVVRRIREDARAVIKALFARPYRILHLAGHGVFELELDGGEAAGGSTVTGMVLGDGVFLTPAEIAQMRIVPELVFINCCHLGRAEDDEEATRRHRHRLAANVAVQLIRMGVRAVVAAGWAVVDDAAGVFAQEFYRQMLAGRPFGKAVLEARRVTFERFRSSNTWGAYQCYGDPAYVLRRDTDAASPATAPDRVTAEECRIELDNAAQAARTASDEEIEALAVRIDSLEEQIIDKWRSRPDLRAALGRAFGEIDRFGKAVEHYEAAVKAPKAGYKVLDLEQLANLRSRWALELFKRARKTGEEPPERPLDLIDRSIGQLLQLPGPGLVGEEPERTVERLALLGSAYKRRALIQKRRKPDLERMADFYRQAHQQAVEEGSGRVNPYPLLNWLACRLVLHLRGREASLDLSDYEHWIAEAEKTAAEDEKRTTAADFWSAVTRSDCAVVRYLAEAAAGKLAPPQTEQRIGEIVNGFRGAARRGSPREFRSVLEHVEWLVGVLAPGARTGRSRRLAHGALVEIRRRLDDLDGRRVRPAAPALRLAKERVARRPAARGMDLAALADHYLGVSGGRNLEEAGPRSRGLHADTGGESATSPLAASVFWQSFMGSEEYLGALRRLEASEGVLALASGARPPGRATRDGKTPAPCPLHNGETFIILHGQGPPRHDLLVFDAGLAPGTVRVTPIEVAASALRRGWQVFEGRRGALALPGSAAETAAEIAVEASSHQPFGMLLVAPPEVELTAPPGVEVPTPPVDVRVAAGGAFASVGVLAGRAGRRGVTTALHLLVPLEKDASQAISTEVLVGGHHKGKVVAVDRPTDSCFIEIVEIPEAVRLTKGALEEKAPRSFQKVDFEGCKSKARSTVVTGFSPELPSEIPGMPPKVLTKAVTAGGDSGAALVDSDGYVLGFAYYRTGFQAEPSFSTWIWAASVFRALQLK